MGSGGLASDRCVMGFRDFVTPAEQSTNAERLTQTGLHRKLVSVVIPTHNRSALLRRAIESVRRQTYSECEIIVVDDASPDDTQEVVADIPDVRIRYVRHTCNKGGSAARNTGIECARGQYIAFLDDDDEWVANKLELQILALGDADAILCAAALNGKNFVKRKPKEYVELRDLRKGTVASGGTGALLARAEVFQRVKFDETLQRCQDWDVFIRIAQSFSIRYLNAPLVKYNEGDHPRISNALIGLSGPEIEKRARILVKHRSFFGSRWFRYHLSGFLLYGLRHRAQPWRQILYAVKTCGISAVVRTLVGRSWQRISTGL